MHDLITVRLDINTYRAWESLCFMPSCIYYIWCLFILYWSIGYVCNTLLLYYYSCFVKLSQAVLISECLQHDDLHESYLKKHFLEFLWLMRDFDFECTDGNGKEISTTDYVLEWILVTTNKLSRSATKHKRQSCQECTSNLSPNQVPGDSITRYRYF